MSVAELDPYRVKAFNTAKASENKIHDDAVARRFGFGGGLVPGVDVYAYMAHQPVARWGRAWLERGTAECRFQKPVYDGDIATVTASATTEGLELRVESHGEICATGRASLPDRPLPPPERFPEPPLPPADRPPASVRSRSRPARATGSTTCAPFRLRHWIYWKKASRDASLRPALAHRFG